MSRLIDADLLMRKCEKWLKPKAPDEDEMVSVADIAVSTLMEIEEQPTAFDINGFYLISRKSDTVSITPLIDGLKNTDFQVAVVDNALITIKTQPATDMRVIYIK